MRSRAQAHGPWAAECLAPFWPFRWCEEAAGRRRRGSGGACSRELALRLSSRGCSSCPRTEKEGGSRRRGALEAAWQLLPMGPGGVGSGGAARTTGGDGSKRRAAGGGGAAAATMASGQGRGRSRSGGGKAAVGCCALASTAVRAVKVKRGAVPRVGRAATVEGGAAPHEGGAGGRGVGKQRGALGGGALVVLFWQPRPGSCPQALEVAGGAANAPAGGPFFRRFGFLSGGPARSAATLRAAPSRGCHPGSGAAAGSCGCGRGAKGAKDDGGTQEVGAPGMSMTRPVNTRIGEPRFARCVTQLDSAMRTYQGLVSTSMVPRTERIEVDRPGNSSKSERMVSSHKPSDLGRPPQTFI